MTEAKKKELREEIRKLDEAFNEISDTGIRETVRKWIQELQNKLEEL
jgi:hypothetical protein